VYPEILEPLVLLDHLEKMVHKENLVVLDQSQKPENKELKDLQDLMAFQDPKVPQVHAVEEETLVQVELSDQKDKQETQDQPVSEDPLELKDLKVQLDFQDQLA